MYSRFPEDGPEWCWNCDPTKREARKAAGAIRRLPPSEERTSRALKSGLAATVDRIIALCLEAGDEIRKGKLAPPAGNALARLYGTALEALRARGVHGDSRGAGDSAAKDLGEDLDPMAALERALAS